MSSRARLNPGGPAALLAASFLLLSACAVRQGALLPEIGDWEQRKAVLGAVDDWEFAGRVGVRAGDEGFNGKLRWTQKNDRFRATVSGPLGIGTVRLEGDGRRIVLTDKDGLRTVLDDAESELYLRYGWTIPVTSLRYWALGIPDPSLDVRTEFDDAGQLARLEQGGWIVSIGAYREGGGQSMPRRLTASGSNTRVRIVVDNWRF